MKPRLAVGALALVLFVHSVAADEGMWLFNNPPKKLLKDKYNFDATPQWLEHVQKSSVRFNSGGSGSFVSASGLVMTNHHVGMDTLQKISTKEKDYVKNGFHAKTQAEEVKATDLELNVLMDIMDVTERVNAAVKPDMDPAAAARARRAAINTLEKEFADKTKLRCDVVTLFQGGQYHLYQFKKYTDVRLVFAPETDIGFFGGDPDNFEYPRYCLDICFFRAYEDGKPAQPKHYLKWSQAGAKDGELTFVSGHPGRTDRLNTVPHLEFLRDLDMPLRLNVIRRREVLLKNFADRSAENERRAHDELFSYQNSRKARIGMLQGLQDPALMASKKKEDAELRAKLQNGHPDALKDYTNAQKQIVDALAAWREMYHEHYCLERGVAFPSDVFGIARTIVRLTEESTKPNAERLREYSEAGLESLRFQLFSESPIYEDLERVRLADGLGMLVEMLGAENETVVKVLNGKSPVDRAAELVRGCKLKDVTIRKQLVDGGVSAVEASADPMIQLARLIDPQARKLRKAYDDKVDEPLKQAYGKVARARFAAYGTTQYPDATFTLRLAFGEVKGYEEQGKKLPYATTLGGAFEHAEAHAHKEPFKLPHSWMERKSRLELDTPFNFVSTADIIGGNSGSPVVNRTGELVGIIFDGNIQSLVLDFQFTDVQARAISVHSAGIVEALKKIYEANELVKELVGK